VHFQDNIRNIVFGSEQGSVGLAVAIAVIALLVVVAIYVWASAYTLRHRRRMLHALGRVVDTVRNFLLHKATSKQQYKPSDITSYFWVNGRPPEGEEGEEYRQLAQYNFEDWHLEVSGLVEKPLHLSLADLRAMPKQTQITKHNCIQGWSAIGEWSGVPVTEVLKVCQPKSDARYLVFTSYQHQAIEGKDRPYYEVIDMELARHSQTILAYEMNGEPLPIAHGAPLRLRVETELGFKMVKYLRSLELVADYSTIGEGQGGYREDVQYYSTGAEI
jgi:DMSO/TMAO reductase YedYZ molybdopterin-dependent catalytic subunit